MRIVTSVRRALGAFSGEARARRDMVELHGLTRELVDELATQVEELRCATGKVAVFWGRSYAGLRCAIEDGCDRHLGELQDLRADLDVAVHDLAQLHGRQLRNTQALLMTLATKADLLGQEISEREMFWKAEAAWAQSLLGERKPSVWPPEPARGSTAAA
jgi:hypothetical protein